MKESGRLEIMKRIFLKKNQQKTILELLREQGEYLDAPCNGKGTCGKCRIKIEETQTPAEPKQREREVFTEQELEDGWRLSCMTVPTGDLYVHIPESRENQIQVQTGFNLEMKTENMGKEKTAYGIAIDIGTTTLAGELISLINGTCIKTASSVNHQRAYGADVISRIRAAMSGDAGKMRESILKDVSNLIETLLAEQKTGEQKACDISKIVIAGNTTMCHLLLGYSCEGLGAAPFTPVNLAPEDMTWGELTRENGQNAISRNTKVQIIPGISAFVGGDITAGMKGCDMRPDKCEMLIDIGTNGEMVLAAGDHFLVSSVAAGPAFEGGNISCGMPGVPGAVCRAVLFGKEKMVTKTIGGKPAIGLCGTGIIDVMYELVRHRIVDAQGTLKEPWFTEGFPIVPGKIYFTQEDIRQVQMAKAAICAGVEVLLQKSHVSYGQIEKVYVAGGFGTCLDMEKALGIGLLPAGLRGKLIPVGNSALEGAARCLTTKKEGNSLPPHEITSMSYEINLADTPEFQELYLKHMQFC